MNEIEQTVVRQLEMIGEDPRRPGLIETPRRYLKALQEMTSGYREDPAEYLQKQFDSEGYDEIIVVRDIEFSSLCEHHLLPFTGHVHLAYIPGEKIVGLSKLPRVVRAYSRRLQVQERMTKQIADVIEQVLSPKAVAVIAEGVHSCMAVRGVECQQGSMITSVVRGMFKEDNKARLEAHRLMGR